MGELPPELPCEANDLDAEAIMQEIRARLRARRDEARARGLDFEAYADGLYPLPPDALFSRELYEAVRRLSLGYDKVGVELALTESRLPLIGRLVQRVRAALHGLVLFYVNQLAARQARFNEQTARALTLLVRDLESQYRSLSGASEASGVEGSGASEASGVEGSGASPSIPAAAPQPVPSGVEGLRASEVEGSGGAGG